MIWFTLLFSLLSLMLRWLMHVKESGDGLTDTEVTKVNHALAMFNSISHVAISLGCVSDEDEKMMESGDVEAVRDRILRMMIEQILLPIIANKLPMELRQAITGYEKEWTDYLTAQLMEKPREMNKGENHGSQS